MSVNLANWNPYTQAVEGVGALEKKAINSKFTLIAVLVDADGKPVNTWANTKKLRPIGLIQNYNLGQNKNIQQVFEIGSDIDINLPGRTYKTFSFGRILLSGKNVLSILATGDATISDLTDTEKAKYGEAGSGEIILNLASEYFDSPCGLAMLFYDPKVKEGDSAQEEILSAVAFEGCMVNAHQMSSSAGDVLVMESVSMMVSRIVPVPTSTLNYGAGGGQQQEDELEIQPGETPPGMVIG